MSLFKKDTSILTTFVLRYNVQVHVNVALTAVTFKKKYSKNSYF